LLVSGPQPTTPVQRDDLHAPSGTVIFREGDPGDSMFIIERGRVKIVLGSADDPAGVAVLEAGDFFGELSLLSGAARTATAEVVEDAVLLVIRRGAFAMMMQDDLGVVFDMLNEMGRRLTRIDQRFMALMKRLRRIRILAGCLQHAARGDGETVVALDPGRLAEDLEVAPSEVQSALADLAADGTGALRDGRFVSEDRERMRKELTEALRRCTEQPTS
jgi:CRP/FNR family transcriptional regulator, cyclic AMP receptor protein